MADNLKSMFVVIGLKNEGLTKGLKQSRRELQQFATASIAMGAAITGAIGFSVKAWAAAGDQVAKMAKRTGLGTAALSELKYAAEISGTSLSAVELATKNMSRVMLDASDGLETAERSFKRLGINVKDLKQLKPEEQFLKIAGAIADISDPTTRAGAALDIFGRSGTDLLPLLQEGSDGMAKLRQEAQDLGIVFDEEAAAKAEKLTDAITNIKKSLDGLKFTIGEAAAPAVQGIAEDATNAMKSFNNWAKENPGLASGLTDIAGKLGMVSLGVGGLIKILPTLITMFKSFGGLGGIIGMGAAGITMMGWGISQLQQGAAAQEWYTAEEAMKGKLAPRADIIKTQQDYFGSTRSLYADKTELAQINQSVQAYKDYADFLEYGAAKGFAVLSEKQLQWIAAVKDGSYWLTEQKTTIEDLGDISTEVTEAMREGWRKNAEALQDNLDKLNEWTVKYNEYLMAMGRLRMQSLGMNEEEMKAANALANRGAAALAALETATGQTSSLRSGEGTAMTPDDWQRYIESFKAYWNITLEVDGREITTVVKNEALSENRMGG